MRDFRDAKAMAQTLREALTAKPVTISHSESLELVSKMLGVSDWNTLSALLQSGRRESGASVPEHAGGVVSYPAIPIRDVVPFPTMTFSLFVGREKTKRALDHAFERNREVVLVVQRDGAVDEPGPGDIYEIGALARLLELERLPDGIPLGGQETSEGTMKILVQVHRRVVVHRFVGEAGAFQAEIADVCEGPIPDAPELVRKAVERYESYVAARVRKVVKRIETHASAGETSVPLTWPDLGQIRDPGRVADAISQHLVLSISDKQGLLATLDPVARLEKVVALLESEHELAT